MLSPPGASITPERSPVGFPPRIPPGSLLLPGTRRHSYSELPSAAHQELGPACSPKPPLPLCGTAEPLASSTTEPEHFRPHPTGDSNTSTHCLGAFVTGGNGKAAKSDEIRKEGTPQKSRVTCAILPFAVGALQTQCVQRNAPSPPEAESASQREGSRSVDSLTSTKLGKPEKISGD